VLKSLQNGGGGDNSGSSGVDVGYTDDFTPLHYFMNLFEGLRKITKIPPIKLVRFEHKIITVSSHHTCKHILHGLLNLPLGNVTDFYSWNRDMRPGYEDMQNLLW
jgi:hypothetical protein